ncbi:MAG: CvpA family protein [Bacteroidales bacterium]|nr:CvpA family protein [Bacteroidales bacterium]
MNWLDLVIAVPLGYLIYKGYRKGIIFELSALVGLVLGIILSVRFANWFANIVGLTGEFAFLISFFIIFVAVIVLAQLAGRLVEKMVKLVHAGLLNNIAGALLGMVKGLCIIGVLFHFMAIVDRDEHLLSRNIKESSMLYEPVANVGTKLTGKLQTYAVTFREMKKSE